MSSLRTWLHGEQTLTVLTFADGLAFKQNHLTNVLKPSIIPIAHGTTLLYTTQAQHTRMT